MEQEREITRREAFGCVGLILATIGSIPLTCSWYRNGMYKRTIEGYREAGTALDETFKASYPNGTIEVSQDVVGAISSAEKALTTYGEMLSVVSPFAKNMPLLNVVSEGYGEQEFKFSMEDLRSEADFSRVENSCLRYRALFSQTLIDCRGTLQDYQISPEVAGDKIIQQYIASIVLRLDRLSSEIDEGTLMTGANIINQTYKYGTFITVIGHVDHYEDCVSELRSLREYLERRAQQATDN